jgi:membrane protein implicated in regulation of membrane protease activity
MMGAGAVIMIPALVMLLFAAAAALMHAGVSDPLAYLIVGVAAAIVSVALVMIGINRLSGDALKPTATIDEIERDKAAAREMVR